jgi:myosin heavy subunit
MAEAAEALQDAAQARRAGDPAGEAQNRRKADDALSAARARLEGASGELARKMEELARIAEEERDLSRKLDEAEKALSALAEQTANSSVQEAKSELEKAAEQSQRSSQSMGEGRTDRAQQQQSESGRSLDRAISELEKAANADSKNPEQDAKALEDLERREEVLREETKALAESIKNLAPAASQSAAKASESMDAASQSLKRKDPGASSPSQQEALDQLEETKKKLDEEKGKYTQLQQEDVLFHLKAEAEKLIKTQEEINKSSTAIHDEVESNGRISRASRRQLGRLSDRQGESKSKVESMLKAIVEEQGEGTSMAIAWLLERIGTQMQEVVEALGAGRADRLTLFQQSEILTGLNDLKLTLEDELNTRRKQKQSPPNQSSPPSKPTLVSVVAELLLVKRLQDAWNRDHGAFWTRNPSIGENTDPLELEVLKQLGNRQNEIRSLFERIMKKLEVTPEESGG